MGNSETLGAQTLETQDDQNLITECGQDGEHGETIRDCDREEQLLNALRPNPGEGPHMYVSEHTDANHHLDITDQQMVDAVFDLAIKYKNAADKAKAEGDLLAAEENMREFRALMDKIHNDEIY